MRYNKKGSTYQVDINVKIGFLEESITEPKFNINNSSVENQEDLSNKDLILIMDLCTIADE